ncbi:lipopolysaccharide biosynthesis protein, partial [Cetobacterium sp.]|uniref:lipopolysaccharide biosynthesis protein n=1 Tax=Cetobacterium sp. TaxID=2071632 RepID=UPI003F3F29E4
MQEKIIKNLRLNFFITIVTGTLVFVSNSYFAKYMGQETLGLMKLFTQMIAYINLVDLGLGSASSYALYKPLVEKNIEKINVVVSTIDSFYKKISILILILGITSSFTLQYFIKNNNYGIYIYIYWILYVLNTSLGYRFAKYSILFIANQEYGFVRKIQGSGKIIFQCIQIIILIKTKSFSLFIIIMICENLYNYYFYSNHYKKNYIYIEKVEERDKNIIKDMKNLFWHKIGGVVVNNTDYIILTKFISLSTVGVYSSYIIISQIVITIVSIITSVLSPKIGKFVVESDKENIYKYWKELYGIYFVIATIFVITTYNLVLPFVRLWLGSNFLVSKTTIILILINLFINLIRGITDIFKTSCGFFDDTYTPGLEAMLNLFFSLVLVQTLGLNGVILGTCISNIFIIFLLRPILIFKRCFNKKGIDYIKDNGKLIFISGLSMFIIQTIIDKFIINKFIYIS